MRTCRRAVVLLTVVLAVQGGSSALADTRDPRPRPAPQAPSAPRGQSGTLDPLTPFAQDAARFAEMTTPFVDAAGDVFFPRG
ncbi:hypothetical protein [Streptomyces sp. NPDC053367]|uniref:hypothetical protein n=1 Tax=Streptomyces sp. NPDC053367 TaxID=3365700 RepID=UPI0037D6E7DA